ncbi:TonB-dependent receptor [Denitratisoma sp. DHT3]|uniref:TonB-dependent receptor n=1 Tax=Denitratisoma sp. DHT3 TaxID=1981880 RepID=UPI0016443D8F|nr:TonB-dependent receptor [Denitratisoma sp. DHT3]
MILYSKSRAALAGRPLLMATAVASALASFANLAAADEAKIDEVIVTAQKRAERLQDVPIAISALSAGQIEARGISNVLDLKALAPNLQVSKYPTSNVTSQISLRGAVTFNGAMYWEPSVGMYLDGVYLGKAVGSVLDVVDVERIEVLRGPQGTLYGRNTMAGAVNMITRKPSGTLSGSVGLEIGNYGYHTEKVSLDLPKLGILSLSLGLRSEKRDGLVKTTAGSPARELDTRDKTGARLAALFDFSPDFQADYRYDHSRVNQEPPHNQLYRMTATTAPMAGMAPYVAQDWQKTASLDYPSYERLVLQGHGLTLTWKLDDRNTLKSITSRRTLKNDDSYDLDGTPLVIATGARIADYTQRSQEFQWIGNTDRLNYVLGLYYYKDRGYTINPHVFYFGTDSSEYGYSADAQSIYGQADYKLTDQWTVSAGLRRTKETKMGSRFKSITGFGSAIPYVEAEASFKATTPMLSLAYKFDEHLNVYGKYSEGFKSGGFQGEAGTAAEARIPFDPEKQKTYEFGVKMSSADGRMQLNAAVFHNDIQDLQISRFTGLPGVSVIRNAGKATVKGLELEGVYVPVDGLRLQAGYGYLDGKYKEFMEAPATGLPIGNVAGNRAFPHAPKHTFNLSVDARLGRSALGVWRGIADYSYTSSFYGYPYQLSAVDPARPLAENSKVKGYGLLNLRLVLSNIPIGGPGSADVALWVKNATDKMQPVNFIDFGPGFNNLTTAYYLQPRTYGASFNYRW